jgi:hypothetical protein
MFDDTCDVGTKGFYTYHARQIHNININRDGGILWWFYKDGQLTAISETNFSGTFVKVTFEEGEGHGDYNCALWLEHDDAYYVFGYFLRARLKPTRLAKWHRQLVSINQGAMVDLWVAPGKGKTHVNMGVTVNDVKWAFDE